MEITLACLMCFLLGRMYGKSKAQKGFQESLHNFDSELSFYIGNNPNATAREFYLKFPELAEKSFEKSKKCGILDSLYYE